MGRVGSGKKKGNFNYLDFGGRVSYYDYLDSKLGGAEGGEGGGVEALEERRGLQSFAGQKPASSPARRRAREMGKRKRRGIVKAPFPGGLPVYALAG